jgi:hypothetical protein
MEDEMLHSRKVLVIAAVSVMGLVSLAFAQMRGSHSNNMPMGQNDTPSQTATMPMNGANMNMPMDSLVDNMSMNYTTMSTDLDKLENHLKQMMRMNDLTELQGEMQKQEQMIMGMRKDMTQQHDMYDRMLLLMKSRRSGRMMGMMNSSETPARH